MAFKNRERIEEHAIAIHTFKLPHKMARMKSSSMTTMGRVGEGGGTRREKERRGVGRERFSRI